MGGDVDGSTDFDKLTEISIHTSVWEVTWF